MMLAGRAREKVAMCVTVRCFVTADLVTLWIDAIASVEFAPGTGTSTLMREPLR